MAEFPAPAEGIVLTHFIVASDVDRTRRFYADVLGGEVLREGEPSIVALANSWIVINAGGPPTDDKPTVTLAVVPRKVVVLREVVLRPWRHRVAIWSGGR
jgi:extradiol dioxygenase family protein